MAGIVTCEKCGSEGMLSGLPESETPVMMSIASCSMCEEKWRPNPGIQLGYAEKLIELEGGDVTDAQFFALSQLTARMHALACEKGWHESDPWKRIPEFVANLHGEISELWEAYRNGMLSSPCDKPIPLSCLEEELADEVIRCMDIAGALKVDLGRAVRIKYEYNKTRPRRHGGKVA